MLLRFVFALLVLCPALIGSSTAESTDCTTPVLIIPDGRITQSTFPQNATYWYGIYTQSNHSYSVEFEPPADNYFNSIRPKFSPITVYSPSDSLQACKGTSSVPTTQNSGYSPVILKNGNGAGRRISFTAQANGLYLISAVNAMGSGAYTFRAVDTTLLSPRWATFGGKDVQWGLFNVSDMPITGTLILLDDYGQVVYATTMTIPAGGRNTRYTGSSDMNVSRNAEGSAVFAHNGPPDSILGDAFLVNSNGTPPFPIKFETLLAH
jgi:hypothetical protein